MKASDILKKAKRLVSTPDKWVQKKVAVDNKGNTVMPSTARACAFCVSGAVQRASGLIHLQGPAWEERFREESLAFEHFSTVIDGSVPPWNDYKLRKHREVLDAFDKAINLALKKEKESC